MYLSKADALTIQDLVKMIDSVTCEIYDILDCGSYDIDSTEDIREEQLKTNVYDFCEPLEN